MDCLNESFESPGMVKMSEKGALDAPYIESGVRSHTKKEVLLTEGS